MSLNDESFGIRMAALTSVGRLAELNPAHVMPCLRKTLIQLLTEFEFAEGGRQAEQSALLLAKLVKASARLTGPYTAPIIEALLRKLHSGRSNEQSMSRACLIALGELAVVGGEVRACMMCVYALLSMSCLNVYFFQHT